MIQQAHQRESGEVNPVKRARNEKRVPVIHLYLCASAVYWPDERVCRGYMYTLAQALRAKTAVGILIKTHELWYNGGEHPCLDDDSPADELCAVLPMSGGVQPLLANLGRSRPVIALINAYLPGICIDEIAHALMHRNAHPACTDYFSARRLQGRKTAWVDSDQAWRALARGWHGAFRLRNARLLKIGETEPWVINSSRDPQVFKERLGTTVIPLEREELYTRLNSVDNERVEALTQDWLGGAGALADINRMDVKEACRVAAAMEDLLEAYDADGLSMACFAMIGEINTTSCLALSSLNDSADRIGACEGDLDSAVTLFLLKAIGADFVWIANPIIHPGNFLELAHCTAPRCGCGERLGYRLMRHHESGRGVAPEVALPNDKPVTLARIGNQMTQIAFHSGQTSRIPKMPTCHTQVRVQVEDTRRILDSLLGTHLVLSFGDWTHELKHAANFLGLEILPANHDPTL